MKSGTGAAYDTVIIGGGLMGSSTALQLALAGRRVAVLEKDSPGRHASGVNAGGLRRLNRHPAEIPLAVAAAQMWQDIAALVDSDCDVKLSGQVRVAESAADLDTLRERAALVRSNGYEHEQLIDRDQLYRLVPALAPHCLGALYTAGDGMARPYHALTAFRRKAESLGVVYHTGHRVKVLDHRSAGWRVVTGQGEFTGRTVVNAAGAWADRICALIDDPVSMTVGAPMMMVTERLPHFLDPVVGATSRMLSFKQMENGTVLIGGAHLAAHDMEHETTTIDFAKLRESSRAVLALFPHMKSVRIVRAWAGLEAFTPDRLPVIGASPRAPGVFHAFGFSAHGFQLAPIVGRIVAEQIQGRPSPLPIEAFRIQRFDAAAVISE
jgi:sarcosine oxidase subunit beta